MIVNANRLTSLARSLPLFKGPDDPVSRWIIKEAQLAATGVELEMYVQATQNVWKYRQKKTASSRTTRVPAQTIRIRTKQTLARS